MTKEPPAHKRKNISMRCALRLAAKPFRNIEALFGKKNDAKARRTKNKANKNTNMVVIKIIVFPYGLPLRLKMSVCSYLGQSPQ